MLFIAAKWIAVQCRVALFSTGHFMNYVQFSGVQCTKVQNSVFGSAGQSSVVQWSAVQCRAVQCSAVTLSALQCSAVTLSALQCNAVACSLALNFLKQGLSRWRSYCTVVSTLYSTSLQNNEVHCTKLHWTFLHFTALHCTANFSWALRMIKVLGHRC